ncbi:MAG: tetratricopeptide repeat protein [Bacteroidota bacterium]
MKSTTILLMLVVLVVLVTFQGFQCASSEFTGAKLAIQQQNLTEAKRLLEIEVQKNPTNEEAWFLLGGIRSEEGNFVGMNQAYGEALKISQKHVTEIKGTRYNRWAFHLNRGAGYLERASPESSMFFDQSLEEFTKAREAWPDTSLTYRYIGYAYNNNSRYAQAIDAFRTAWDKGKDVESLKRAARLYIYQGDQQKNAFESDNADKLKNLKNLQGVRRNNRKSDVIAALGAPDRITRGPRGSKKEDLIYNRFNLTVSIDDDKVTRKTFSKPYNPSIDSSKYHGALVEYEKAIQLLLESKGLATRDSETLSMLLTAYVQANRIQEAIAEYERAVELNPGDKQNQFILGVLYRSAGDYEKAVARFSEAYALDPAYTDALFDLGATYYNWGVDMMRLADEKGEPSMAHKEKFKLALPHIEKVSELKPDDIQVWETLGTIYAQLGMQEKALAAFDRADKLRAGN